MARIGLLTMSDGRDFVHRDIADWARSSEDAIAAALEGAGHEVVRAPELVSSNALASSQARLVAEARPDLTVFNYSVWAFPHFSMLAADATPGPLVLLSNIDPVQPEHGQVVTADEMPELVEDAVVRQVVLGLGEHDAAVVQHGERVLWRALRPAQPLGVRSVLLAVEITDDDGDVAQSFGGEPTGQPAQRPTGRVDETGGYLQVAGRRFRHGR